jgi:hypothetical protein
MFNLGKILYNKIFSIFFILSKLQCQEWVGSAIQDVAIARILYVFIVLFPLKLNELVALNNTTLWAFCFIIRAGFTKYSTKLK